MKTSIISFTENGNCLNVKLKEILESEFYNVHSYTSGNFKIDPKISCIETSVTQWTKENFQTQALLIFIGSCGIAVRCIAPFIKSKTSDPAVLVLDEFGQYVIPILSGHIGGANAIALKIANLLNAQAIMTTATDLNHKLAVDVFAKKNDLWIHSMKMAKMISSEILKNNPVGLISRFPISGQIPETLTYMEVTNPSSPVEYGICISLDAQDQPFKNTLVLTPKVLTLGIGCRRGVSCAEIEAFVMASLNQLKCSMKSIKAVASIDLKEDEKGLLEFCKLYNLKSSFYASETLNQVVGEFSQSEFVKQTTGVDCVCERAAIKHAHKGQLILKKQVQCGVTLAIAVDSWEVNFG